MRPLPLVACNIHLIVVCHRAGFQRRDPADRSRSAEPGSTQALRWRRRCTYIRATRPGRARITRLSISGSTSTTVLQMSPDLLCRIGAALYGEHWHSSLAHDLGVPRRTVQRWAAGDARPPPTLRRDLARLVAARQDELGKLYRELTSS